MDPQGAGVARADGPALSEARSVEAVWRIESARIVGALARYTGDFALAEDVAQDALAEALVAWPRDGVPPNPAAWLLTVARRRAIDAFRRRSVLDEKYAVLARGLSDDAGADDLLVDPDVIDDDLLALMFVSCHPVLSPDARVGLTLRVVGGLTTEEIARAFLVPVPTVQARITRAKKTLRAAGVPFEVPPRDQRRERLGGVLSVLYVIFTEGSTATAGADLLRPDLAQEARRLARVLTRLQPDEAETHGLLALMELTSARFPARVGPDGEAVLLEDQDRGLWDRAAIVRGLAALERATAVGRGLGPYGLQAAIAACHAAAPSVEDDRLGADRAALRGARPDRALAGGRPQPGGRGRDGPRPGDRTRGRRRPGGLGPAGRLAPAADGARRAAGPARTDRRGPRRAGAGGPAVRERPRARRTGPQGRRAGRHPRAERAVNDERPPTRRSGAVRDWLAVAEGFEPSVGLHPQTLSRRSP